MTRVSALLLLVSITAHAADPMSMSGAFSEGTNFGRARNAATQANVKSGAGQANVPHATSSAPETSYFGSAGLGVPASAKVNACATGSFDPNAYDDQACQAVNFSQTNPLARPQFTINSTDPIMATTRAILNDPAAIAGNIAGTYSGCTTQTVKTPDIHETAVCNEYRTLEQHTCYKTLTVTVTDNGLNCSYGDYITPNPRIVFIRPYVFVGAVCAEEIKFMWTYGYSECNGTTDSIYVPTIVPSPDSQRLIVNLGCGGQYYLEGSCPGGNCSYTVGIPDGNLICERYCDGECCQGYTQDLPLASFAYQRPIHTYSITDSWDNQCAAFEARLP